jgi:hypothetical protein
MVLVASGSSGHVVGWASYCGVSASDTASSNGVYNGGGATKATGTFLQIQH